MSITGRTHSTRIFLHH